ncbi:ROK family protein [Rhodococcus tibetensis]|uniref:ROK family protein n=1 Tax=Rhodococcus tibetensis TaxID=2965064 RepID=A0ABT1QJ27_9NOCA|nr:ROK family protein [Rhodococcus sp. FXJ9.536]MCQ4121107.1 ROK family protein [Rhodococcus sp. FXJ9.536]
MARLALDIGGTKIAAGLVGEGGTVPAPSITATPAAGVWDACAALLRKVAADATITSVGIACAGPVDSTTGRVSPINIDEWSAGFGLVTAVRDLFPGARTQLAMDGAAAALGEHRHGAGRGTTDLVSLVVSTGIGGGVVLAGRIATGRTGNAGHIGHMVVPGGAEACTCGGIGCLETMASGPASVRWARSHGWTGATGIDLASSAAAGDPVAVAALDRAGTALGAAIASAAALLDVDLAVVGGGFAQAGPALWRPMRAAAARHARLTFVAGLRIVPAELGSTGTLVGAGVLALDD